MKTLLTAILIFGLGSTLGDSSASEFETQGIVPDIIDESPASLATISYSGDVTLEIGQELTPTQVKEQPTVEWDADSSKFYTLIMTDPDVPSRAEPTEREWRHWMVGNIPGSNVEEGDVLAAYIRSGPAYGTGLHRYSFLIYEQPEKIDFTETPLSNLTIEGRSGVSTKEFVAEYNLGDLVAGSFYVAEYDDSVPELYELLGVEA